MSKIKLKEINQPDFKVTKNGMFLSVQLDKNNELNSISYMVLLYKSLGEDVASYEDLMKKSISRQPKNNVLRISIKFNNIFIEHDKSHNISDIISFLHDSLAFLVIAHINENEDLKMSNAEDIMEKIFLEADKVGKGKQKPEIFTKIFAYNLLP